MIRSVHLKSMYAEFGGAVAIVGRKELHDLLLKKVGETRVIMHRTIVGIAQRNEKCEVQFDDGSSGMFDVVVGADGVHSKVRDLVFHEHIESYRNWRAWYVWIDNAFAVPGSIVEYIEPRENITVFAAGGKTLATMFAPADHKTWDNQEGRIQRLKDLFKDESHVVPQALENIRDTDVMPTDLADVSMRHTVRGHVALIGDAAHCFGPMAGLGTAMALEDAYTLAAELQCVSSVKSIEDALATYEQHRKKRRHLARRLNKHIRLGALIKSRLWARVVMLVAPIIPERLLTDDYRKLLREEI